MSLYTVNINLFQEPCLVIGGGNIAARKIEKLLDAGAIVTVISPELTDELVGLNSEQKIQWINRFYEPGDIKGYILVIASTDDPKVNEAVYTEARKENVLVNCVDKPAYCNFYVPAIIQRGDLQIAISTSGSAPFLSKRIRMLLEEHLYDGLAQDLEELKQMRNKLKMELSPEIIDREEEMRKLLKPTIDKIISKLDTL